MRLALLLVAAVAVALPQNIITTIVGTDTVFQDNGLPATQARIGRCEGIVVAPDGTVYFSDRDNNQVYKVGADGIIRVVFGNGIAGSTGDGGPATGASSTFPLHVSLDASGNLYVAETTNSRIRKITPDGIVTTVAGNGRQGFSGDEGPAVAASLRGASGVAFDSAGAMYIADTGNQRIRKVTPDGIIHTIAGTGNVGFTGDGGPALNATFNNPYAVAVDPSGDLYIADITNGRIRKISAADGSISSIASVGSASIQLGANGLLYVTNGSNVATLTKSGTRQNVAGTGSADFSGDGGNAIAAALNLPRDAAPAPDGGFYIADSGNFRIRRVSPGGIITTIAGSGTYRTAPEGAPGNTVQLGGPLGLSVDPAGNLYIAEYNLSRVRRMAPDGTVTTVAGTGRTAPTAVNGGPANKAALYFPTGAAADAAGNVYIADSVHAQIRKVDTSGIITLFAGSGTNTADGIPATTAQLSQMQGIAVTADGIVYIADTTNHKVRKVAKDGLITTIAGTGAAGFNGDGVATQSQLNTPVGIAVDAQGNVYICDSNNSRLRKVTTDGKIATIAGNGAFGSPVTGAQGTASALSLPQAVAVDSAGNVFVASSPRVFRLAVNGTMSTVAGTAFATPFVGDGGPATSANIGYPRGLAVDAAGNLYIADFPNERVRVVLATPPSFQAAPVSLNFGGAAGGGTTSAQSISISTTAPGVPFTVTNNLPSWLLVTPLSGSLPTTLQVIADPGKLTPGSYSQTITINASNAVPATQTVKVTFTVTSAAPPKLLVADSNVTFAFGARSNPTTRNIAISNAGGGSLAFTAAVATTSGGPWLSVAPASGTVTPANPVVVGLRADPGTLAPGVYLGTLTIASAATNERAVIAVTMTINAQRQSIQLSQSGLTFTAVANGGFILPQSFSVLNSGQGVMNWTATPSTLSGGGWLAVSPASGATDAGSNIVPAVQVSVSAANLAAGTYYGRVIVAASTADNSPQVVLVVLNVLPAGTNPGAQVQPAALIFTGAAGASAPSSQNVLLGNPAAKALNYVSGRLTLDGATWFIALPPTGSVPIDQAATIVVQPDPTGLTPGVRRGVLTLLFNDGSVRNVSTLLVLTAGGGSTNVPEGVSAHAAGCAPSKLLPLVTSILQDFNIPASWPIALTAKVVDDCGNPMTAGSVSASFSNGDPPLSLASLKDGNWSASWQPRNSAISSATIAISAQIPEQNLQGSISISGSLQKNPDPPQINAGGIVSAASFSQVGVLAPASFISIYGARFADGLNVAPSYPWITELAGTEVVLGGRSLPLYFTSTGQINAVVPVDTPVNTQQQLIVRRGTTYTVPEPVSIAAAQPAIFTPTQNGQGQGYVLVHSLAGTETLADPKNPARAGDVVVTYCAGLGTTNPPVADGLPSSSTALTPTVNPVIISIGGKQITPLFAGLVPGFIGLYQVNAVIPTGITPGDAVPVVLTVGGQSSPVVTMAVK